MSATRIIVNNGLTLIYEYTLIGLTIVLSTQFSRWPLT